MKNELTAGAIVSVTKPSDDVRAHRGRVGEILQRGAPNKDSTFAGALLVGFCDGTQELFWPEEVSLA